MTVCPVAAQTGQFTPQDLGPDFYAESVATFTNPHTNADCVGFEDPNYCCTGPGTGSCDEPVASFEVVDCTTRNLDCTGAGTPYACCSGFQSGSCCYEEADSAHGYRGNSYCPASVCPEGCVNQWIDQSGFKSSSWSHPITGRALEQDDLEKPCYKSNCINGHACLEGHPAWVEPDYPADQQPYQDATLEFEPPDRTAPFSVGGCPGPFYSAQLVRIVPQTDRHRLLAGFTVYDPDANQLFYAPYKGGWVESITDVLPALGEWYLIEWQRDSQQQVTVWVNEENKTPINPQTNTGDMPFSIQHLCNAKSCETAGNQEFQGEAAMLLYKCGTPPTKQELIDFRAYVEDTFGYLAGGSVFFDNFESANPFAWTVLVP